MASDGWKKIQVSRGNLLGDKPEYRYEKEGGSGGLVIERASNGGWKIRYRVGTETSDGYAYRVRGQHQLFRTLEEAKQVAENRADHAPPPQ